MTDHDTQPMQASPDTVDPPPGTLRHQEEFEHPPRGVRVMAVFRWFLIAVMAVVATLSVAYSFGLVSTGSANASAKQYYCPMHPQVVQDHPGECPICSMSLVLKPSSANKSETQADAKDKKESVSHEGHRHNPSDPYYCPMHPEETGTDASARCPICKMKLEPRAGGAAAGAAGSSGAGPHAGHRHNPGDPYYCPMHPEETGTDPSARDRRSARSRAQDDRNGHRG